MAPLANFMAAGGAGGAGEMAHGLFGSVTTVPAGFSHATVLVAGRGVAATLGAVGARLLAKGGKARTTLQHPTDLSLTSLGCEWPPADGRGRCGVRWPERPAQDTTRDGRSE